MLVQMPFADIVRPSLALSLLKAKLQSGGIRCAIVYPNITYADQLGGFLPDFPYLQQFLGEWIFASAAFPDCKQGSPDSLIARNPQVNWLPCTAWRDPRMREILIEAQAYSPTFVDSVARRVVASGARIVGCSSMFEQHCAALALLRRIKELSPEIITMMGGANCEAEMGWTTLRAFPWIDYVVSGEADELILPFCRNLLQHGTHLSLESLPIGVLARSHVAEGAFAKGGVPRASVLEMDRCPVPDFTDYFAELGRSGFHGKVRAGLPVETSRGCWWGARSHCTFCGLNGSNMTYRSKSPERVIEELELLSNRYNIRRFMVVDNILDMKYLKSVVPELGRKRTRYQIFYETKANLKRDQVRSLAEAGVIWFQPGIEGLHDDLLKLMAKGNSTMINIQLLKYAREFGIYTTWLMLVGFPKEEDTWHQEVAEWLPMVFHLQPPTCMESVFFERFSVFHNRPESFGLDLKPDPFYSAIFPLPADMLQDLAYFFVQEDRVRDSMPSSGRAALSRQVSQWVSLHKRPLRPLLCMDRSDTGEIRILDTRPCATARRHVLGGWEARLYEACDPATTRKVLLQRFENETHADEIETALSSLIEKKLLLDFGGKLLALAVQGNCPAFCNTSEYPGGNGRRPPPFQEAVLDQLHTRLQQLIHANPLTT